jgi:hypothetical protein
VRPPFLRTRTRHPEGKTLALYAGGDLSFGSKLAIRAHLLQCAECEHEVDLLSRARQVLRQDAAQGTLTAFEAIADWRALESEMVGNIVVGVAAARCIDKVGHRNHWLARSAIAAGIVLLFAVGWMTHIPSEQTAHLTSTISHYLRPSPPAPLGNAVQATPVGLAVGSQGVTLTIMHPSTAVVSLAGQSSLEARYLDEDSGQLTITAVYGQ